MPRVNRRDDDSANSTNTAAERPRILQSARIICLAARSIADRSRIEHPRRLASLNLGKCRKGIEEREEKTSGEKGEEKCAGQVRPAALEAADSSPRGSSESFSGPSASLVSVRIASSARLANDARRFARSRPLAPVHPRDAERKLRGSQQT